MSTQTPDYERNKNKRALIYGLVAGITLLTCNIIFRAVIYPTQGSQLGLSLFLLVITTWSYVALGLRLTIKGKSIAYYIGIPVLFAILSVTGFFILQFFFSILREIFGSFYWLRFFDYFHQETRILLFLFGMSMLYVLISEVNLYFFRKDHKL